MSGMSGGPHPLKIHMYVNFGGREGAYQFSLLLRYDKAQPPTDRSKHSGKKADIPPGEAPGEEVRSVPGVCSMLLVVQLELYLVSDLVDEDLGEEDSNQLWGGKGREEEKKSQSRHKQSEKAHPLLLASWLAVSELRGVSANLQAW